MDVIRGAYSNGFAPRDGMPLYPSLWQGCVGAWAPCLGPTGLTVRDLSGFANHGSLTSLTAASAWIASSGRYAIATPGTSGVGVTVTSNIMLSIPAGQPWSVSLWFRRNTSGRNDGVINKATSSIATNEWSIAWFGADLYWIVGDPAASAYIGRRGAWNVTGWRHICCTYDGGTTASSCRIFGDGVQIDTTNYTAGTFSATNATASNMRFAIDTYLSGTSGLGDYDDARIYRRMLSLQEIRLLASRRGIAYDMDQPVWYAPEEAAAFRAAWALRQKMIIGSGGGLG